MPLFESKRKIQAFGSSLAITLPSTFTKIQMIKKGSTLNVYYGLEAVVVVVYNENDVLNSLKDVLKRLNGKDKNDE